MMSATCPCKRDDFWMVRALREMTAANIPEHVGHIVFRVDLKEYFHRLAALGTSRILGALYPSWPAEQLVSTERKASLGNDILLFV